MDICERGEEIKRTREALPVTPPECAIEAAKKRMKKARLVYRAGWRESARVSDVRCTACGRRFHLEYVKENSMCRHGYGGNRTGFIDPVSGEVKFSGDDCVCPFCGAAAKALHVSAVRTSAPVENIYFLTLHNVRGHMALLSWNLMKKCDKNGDVCYDLGKYEGAVMIGGKPIRFVGYYKGMFGVISWLEKWTDRKQFLATCDDWETDELLFPDQDAFDASDGAKSALDVFLREGGVNLRPFAYLQLFAKWPQIENLVRSGYAAFVNRMIILSTGTDYGYGYKKFLVGNIKKYIDVRRKKPHEMLGVEKADTALAEKYPPDVLSFFSYVWKRDRIRLSEAELKHADLLGFAALRTALGMPWRPPTVRTVHYLMRERMKDKTLNAQYLLDYWNMVREVYHGECPAELMYPRDLTGAHDRMTLLVRVKTDQAINEKIAAFAAMLAGLVFEDAETGLLIRPCRTHEELIKEGKFLSHCVGTYAERVAAGETAILFIRRIKEPDIPYYTLEYSGGRVVQNRGKKNCGRTEDVIRFEAKWMEFLKTKAKKGKKNDGKCNRSETREHARA